MSWSDRRSVLFGLGASCLGLSSCGFTPVYAPGGTGDVLRGQVALRQPTVRIEFELAKALEDRLGRSDGPLQLDYAVRTVTDERAISGNNATLRFQLTGTVQYTLSGPEGPVDSGTVTNFVSYGATGTSLATTAARLDAEDRLMLILAETLLTEITQKLALAGG